MSRSLEAFSPAPSTDKGVQNAVSLVPDTQYFLSCTNLFFKFGEQQLLGLQMLNEMVGTVSELQKFGGLAYSCNKRDRDLYFGTQQTQGHKFIVMINGFSPYNPYMEHAVIKPFADYYQAFYPVIRPNALLDPKKEWYERHGHNVRYAFKEPNHIWYSNLKEAMEKTERAVYEAGDPKKVFLSVLSAGSVHGEIITKRLGKQGMPINLITNGSPEVNLEILQEFDEATRRPGIMGNVHNLAHLNARMDKDADRMQEEMFEAAKSDFHPLTRVVRFYSNNDSIVPRPKDPNAIEVGGYHAVIPYRRKVLEMEEELLADSNNLQSAHLAA